MTLTETMELALQTFTFSRDYRMNEWEEKSLPQLRTLLNRIVISKNPQRILLAETLLEQTPHVSPVHSHNLVETFDNGYKRRDAETRDFISKYAGDIAKKLPDWDTYILEDSLIHKKIFGINIASQILECALRMSDTDFQIFSDEEIEKSFSGIKEGNFAKRFDLKNMQFSPYNQQTARLYSTVTAGGVFGGDMRRHWRDVRMLDFLYNGPLTETGAVGVVTEPKHIERFRLTLKPEIVQGLLKTPYYKRKSGFVEYI